ncbi:MAG: NAD(P)-dependent oxidoreductase, partial [Gemmatimonadota bacterium]
VPITQLDDVLLEAEFLVLVVPHADDTVGLLDRRRIGLLPRGSVVINIGRGALIDEPALIDALTSGHLGGAGLDVFEEEPLPSTSPLWQMPNVIVSPHSAGTSDRENARLLDLFVDNLGRWQRGETLRNVLDPAAILETPTQAGEAAS